jgi:hypothetical protein
LVAADMPIPSFTDEWERRRFDNLVYDACQTELKKRRGTPLSVVAVARLKIAIDGARLRSGWVAARAFVEALGHWQG